MLYEIERDPGSRSKVLEALRQRGIDFQITDGLRGLTSSKSKGDSELRRTLEEAGRRRSQPASATLPSASEFDAIISKSRDATLLALEEMPDFVVRQQIQRSLAFAGTNNFRSQDRLVVAVSYRSSGAEEYKLLSLNGVLQNDPKPKSSYEEVGGTSSTGEFVTVLAKIFKPESETTFSAVDTDILKDRRTLVVAYEVSKDRAKQAVIAGSSGGEVAITGMRGKVWIDRENHRVLRIETEATEIPTGFPITSARRVIDYDWVTISDGRYLLPSVSDVRLTFREGGRAFDSRNLIRFREYQKFGTDIRILEDDVEDISKQENR